MPTFYGPQTVAQARHPNKEIREAIAFALERGWRFFPARKHFGMLRCPLVCGTHQWTVSSTPGNPHDEAEKIDRVVKKCLKLREPDISSEQGART
jgi:hypothetical protein